MADRLVQDLIDNQIPEGRRALKDSHKNLHELAAYCETNYVNTKERPRALAETKQYAAQSLASVAYQINSLASSMLQLLDQQVNQMNDMEADIHYIAQVMVELDINQFRIPLPHKLNYLCIYTLM